MIYTFYHTQGLSIVESCENWESNPKYDVKHFTIYIPSQFLHGYNCSMDKSYIIYLISYMYKYADQDLKNALDILKAGLSQIPDDTIFRVKVGEYETP